MRKKITMLLASLFACVGVMQADVTKFYKPGERVATLTAGQQVMFYNTAFNGDEDRTGFLIDNGSNFGLSKQKPSASPFFSEKVGVVWTIEVAEDNTTYYKVNVMGANGYVGIGGKTNNAAAQDMYIHKWTEIDESKRAGVKSEQADGTVIENAAIAAGDNVWLVANGATADAVSTTWNGNPNSFATWATGHPYAMYSVVEAETTDLEALLATAKSDALIELESFAKLTISTAATAITEVNAVVLENNDLEAALNAIDAIVLGAKKSMDGKSIVFDNTHTDVRAGLSITAKDGNAYGTSSEGDETIWTIKSQADGSFKLYNFVTNKYLNTPGTAALADEAGAACYKFIVTDVNKVALVTTTDNKMLHQASYWGPTNYDLLSWYDLNDAASLWTITEKEIKVSREQYDLATAARASLPYAIQQAYGLVTDAAKYTSNAPETKPAENSSYANLLDNNYSTYFHSAWSYGADGNHYLQAEVSEEVKDFCFYFKKREDTNNNRPTEIEILGSTDGTEFTTITTINSGLPTNENVIDYFSAKITAANNVKHLRFVVKNTNTPTGKEANENLFFHFSEFYIFPATSDVTALIDSYNAFASLSITEEGIVNAATSLINAESTLALANIKKEVAALLAANEENHAETPALGQYTTEAYNALNTAYNAADATQESLEEAIAAFEAAKNVPVYFITSAHDDYAAGSAIYYDGAWKWKTANIYDRQMWMTIQDYTNADVPVVDEYDASGTHYKICDYLTGTVMRGKSVQIVKIEGWDDAYNLQYGTTVNDAVQHAQAATWGSNIVGWNAATTDGNKASAWGVEFIGGSYDLDKLTDEYIAALVGLQSAYDAKAYAADAEIGEGLGQYQGDKEAIVTVLNAGKAILDKSLVEQAALDVADINSAAEDIKNVSELALNMPAKGKFYRIKSVNSGNYVTAPANTGVQMTLNAEASANNILYWDAEGHLLVYGTGYYTNGKNHANYGYKDTYAVEGGKTGVAGAYAIKPSTANYWHDNGANLDVYQNGTHANCNWTIEEVTTLPVAVSAAGYATLYAPVALTIPAEGVTVYTATVEDGYLALTEVEGAIPANTGVIIEAAEGTYNFAVAAEAADVESDLVGAYAKSEKNAEAKVYTLQKPTDKEVGFYLFNGQDANENKTYINGFRAWVEVANGEAAPAMFSLGRGEGTTAIGSVELTNDNVVIYDLSGRRVEKMEKGIYIVNGKKVIR